MAKILHSKICELCKREFTPNYGYLTKFWNKRRFCSVSCGSKAYVRSTEQKIAHKIGARSGERNSLWKGAMVSYRNLHRWVYRWLGKPCECVHCGESNKRIEWASVSHSAKRDLSDYIPLCVACHRNYDRKGGVYFGRT